MTQTIAPIIGLAAIASFDLVSIAWLCLSGTQQPARRRMHSAWEPTEADERDLLVTLACLGDSLAGEATGQKQTVALDA